MRHLLLAALLAFAADKTVRFDKADVGKLPAGWKAAQTYEGKGSVWAVVTDATAPSGTGCALAQTAKRPVAAVQPLRRREEQRQEPRPVRQVQGGVGEDRPGRRRRLALPGP